MSLFFFFNDTATTEIYTLSLHDALPIWPQRPLRRACRIRQEIHRGEGVARRPRAVPERLRGREPEPSPAAHRARRPRLDDGRDRKSTRLNSSHLVISYAVFCLKKKQQTT